MLQNILDNDILKSLYFTELKMLDLIVNPYAGRGRAKTDAKNIRPSLCMQPTHHHPKLIYARQLRQFSISYRHSMRFLFSANRPETAFAPPYGTSARRPT